MLPPMRRSIPLLFLALLAAVPAALGEEALVPKAVFETTNFDGGAIAPGADVQASFTVRNDGTGELRILAVKPG
jgi:hypothetical protein